MGYTIKYMTYLNPLLWNESFLFSLYNAHVGDGTSDDVDAL